MRGSGQSDQGDGYGGNYHIRVNNVCPCACATLMFLANPANVVDKFNQASS
ncbi:hypothetical protein [Endozoicomonas sp. YOMI1]|uniref:hypothetical protein n=1 Tax=Endozoicomonas sp. YOMI1 TaxID=2828739 RepID=UPI002147A186|nr:hypothetical protein [Endozoicomonas sp. YOMI1]